MLRKREEGKQLILEVLELPALSDALNRVLKVTGNNRSSASDMAAVIGRDELLASNVLKIANSAYFGLSQQVPTVSRAILVLGFDAVKSIALSASVIGAFPRAPVHDHFDRSRFWTHSLACAYISKMISGMTHLAELETSFVCGLLHDIGKIAMDVHFPASYRRLHAKLVDGEVSLVNAEYQIFGFTHAEVGMWMAQRWKFPKSIVFSIANHHGMISEDSRYKRLTSTIRLANHLCLREGICLPHQISVDPLEESIMRDLKLNSDDLARLTQTLAARKEAFVSLFSSWD